MTKAVFWPFHGNEFLSDPKSFAMENRSFADVAPETSPEPIAERSFAKALCFSSARSVKLKRA